MYSILYIVRTLFKINLLVKNIHQHAFALNAAGTCQLIKLYSPRRLMISSTCDTISTSRSMSQQFLWFMMALLHLR